MLLRGDLVDKVGTLVLIDPLGNPFSLGLTSVSKSLGVGGVGKTQVGVMGRVLDVDSDALVVDLLKDATSVPRVQVSVGEDYVRGLSEVALRHTATEVVESPVVLGSLTVSSLTLGRGLLLVPSGSGEHGGDSVRSERHDHLVASLDTPAVVVKTTTLLNRDIEAVELTSVVVEGGTGGSDGVQSLVGISFMSFEGSLLLLTGVVDGPSGKGLNEVSWVRIVDHSHSAKGISEGINETLDLNGTSGDGTETEDIADVLVGARLLSKRLKLLEAGLDVDRALGISLGEIASGDVIVSVGGNISVKEEDRGTGGQSTLEDVRVLHSEPSGEHTTVGAATNNDSAVLEAVLLLEVDHELNVVHLGLLN